MCLRVYTFIRSREAIQAQSKGYCSVVGNGLLRTSVNHRDRREDTFRPLTKEMSDSWDSNGIVVFTDAESTVYNNI